MASKKQPNDTTAKFKPFNASAEFQAHLREALDVAALGEMQPGRAKHWREAITVLMALARAEVHSDEGPLGNLATFARKELRAGLKRASDERRGIDPWALPSDWVAALVETTESLVAARRASGRVGVSHDELAAFIVNMLKNTRVEHPARSLLGVDNAAAKNKVAALLKQRGRRTARVPGETVDSEALAVTCINDALEAIGLPAPQRKLMLQSVKKARRRARAT